MITESLVSGRRSPDDGREELSRRLDAIGWALFLIWVGVAFFAELGWGWGLLGVGAIVLGMAAYRWSRGLGVDGPRVAVGVMLLVAALWSLFELQWPLVPLILIGCGLMVLWGAFRGRHLIEKQDGPRRAGDAR